MGAARRARLRAFIDESEDRLACADARYFAERLPPAQHWRLFPTFRDRYACLDIETTGLGGYGDHVTVMSLYDGRELRHYTWDENLEAFQSDVDKYLLLVTFNGKGFDVPFLRNCHGMVLDQAHIDLRYVLRSAGISGGLKACEQKMGLQRGPLDGVDGYWAVLLWDEFQRNSNHKALETLLAYNITDTVNLVRLMYEAYNLKLRGTPFEAEKLPVPEGQPAIPFTADQGVLEKIRARLHHAGFG